MNGGADREGCQTKVVGGGGDIGTVGDAFKRMEVLYKHSLNAVCIALLR